MFFGVVFGNKLFLTTIICLQNNIWVNTNDTSKPARLLYELSGIYRALTPTSFQHLQTLEAAVSYAPNASLKTKSPCSKNMLLEPNWKNAPDVVKVK